MRGTLALAAAMGVAATMADTAEHGYPTPPAMDLRAAMRKAGHYDDTKAFPYGPYQGGRLRARWDVRKVHRNCILHSDGGGGVTARAACVLWTSGELGANEELDDGVCRCDNVTTALPYCESWSCTRARWSDHYVRAVRNERAIHELAVPTVHCECDEEADAAEGLRPGVGVGAKDNMAVWQRLENVLRAEEALGNVGTNATWLGDSGRYCQRWSCRYASAKRGKRRDALQTQFDCSHVSWQAVRLGGNALQMVAHCNSWEYHWDQSRSTFGAGACTCADAKGMHSPHCANVACTEYSMDYYSPPYLTCLPLSIVGGTVGIFGIAFVRRLFGQARTVSVPREHLNGVRESIEEQEGDAAAALPQRRSTQRAPSRAMRAADAACMYGSILICGPGVIPLALAVGAGALMPFLLCGVFGTFVSVIGQVCIMTLVFLAMQIHKIRASKDQQSTADTPPNVELAEVSARV